jgi:hypothetical protein
MADIVAASGTPAAVAPGMPTPALIVADIAVVITAADIMVADITVAVTAADRQSFCS